MHPRHRKELQAWVLPLPTSQHPCQVRDGAVAKVNVSFARVVTAPKPNASLQACHALLLLWLPAQDAAWTWCFLFLPQSSQQRDARSRWGPGRH